MDSSSRSITVHGVLVSVHGVGVLLVGKAGLGKSECALRLLSQGFQLVADDVVKVDRRNGYLAGRAPSELKGLLSSRIFGLLDIAALYGKDALVETATIDLFVEFVERHYHSQPQSHPTTRKFLDVPIPGYSIGVDHARDIADLVVLAARLHTVSGATVSIEKVMGQGFGN